MLLLAASVLGQLPFAIATHRATLRDFSFGGELLQAGEIQSLRRGWFAAPRFHVIHRCELNHLPGTLEFNFPFDQSNQFAIRSRTTPHVGAAYADGRGSYSYRHFARAGLGEQSGGEAKRAFNDVKSATKNRLRLRVGEPLTDTPERIAELLREENRFLEVETFQVVLVNTRRRLIRVEKISDGTLDTILVHPREVFRCAIAANASAVILVHNHPSGDPTPSEADIKATRDLIRAGQLLKIDLLDHVILGRATAERSKDYASLKELGYFYS